MEIKQNIHLSDYFLPKTLNQLPEPPNDFTGRTIQINRLIFLIEKEYRNIIGIFGMPGIGKTSLALMLARRLINVYPDAQFYINLYNTNKESFGYKDIMRYIILSVFPEINLPEDINNLRSLYYSCFHNKKCIIFIDNINGSLNLSEIIPPSTSLLITTSRGKFTLPGMLTEKLDILSYTESYEMITKICGPLENFTIELINLCGMIPFALRVAASTLAERPDISPAYYIDKLKDQLSRVKLIESSLNLTYEILSYEERRFWCCLSIFPESFADFVVSEILEIDSNETKDMLSTLHSYSLIEWNEKTERYKLHDLTRIFIASYLDQDLHYKISRKYCYLYLCLLVSLNELYEFGGDNIVLAKDIFILEWPNFQESFVWSQRNIIDEEIAAWCNLFSAQASIMIDIYKDPDTMLLWSKIGLEAAKKLEDKSAEASQLNNIAMYHYRTNDFKKSINILQKALSISEDIESIELSISLIINIIANYIELGDIDTAIRYYEKISNNKIQLSKKNLIIGVISAAIAINNSLGYIDKVINLSLEAINMLENFGDLHGKAFILGNLGNAYAQKGMKEESTNTLIKALDISKKVMDQRLEAKILSNVGLNYLESDDSELALEAFYKALNIDKKTNNLQGQAENKYRIGFILCNYLDSYDQGLNLINEALTIARSIGDKHQEAVIGSLFAIFCHNKDINPPDGVSPRMLFDYYKRIGHKDLDKIHLLYQQFEDEKQIKSHIKEASIFFKSDSVNKAINLLNKALKLCIKNNFNSFEANILGVLSDCYIKLNNYEIAIQYLKKSIEVRNAPDNEHLLSLCYWNLGYILYETNNISYEDLINMKRWLNRLSSKSDNRMNYFSRAFQDICVELADKLMDEGIELLTKDDSGSFHKITTSLNIAKEVDIEFYKIIIIKVTYEYYKLGYRDVAIHNLYGIYLLSLETNDEILKKALKPIFKPTYYYNIKISYANFYIHQLINKHRSYLYNITKSHSVEALYC